MNNIVINFVGDVCLKDIDDFTYNFSNEIRDIFSQSDINVANLECVLSSINTPAKYRTIRLKGEPVENSIYNTFSVYSLANNHIMDFGNNGLSDTIHFLDNTNKYHFGAGINEFEALKPLCIEKNGFKLAFLSFNRFDVAKDNKAGTAPEKFKKLHKYIKELKSDGYFVIIYPHWNYQWVEYPAPDERKKGYKMIDAGADIIIEAHPHIVQGYEIYKGKYIFHSLGNFVFRNTKYTKSIPQFGKTFILQLCIKDNYEYSYKIIPVFNDNNGARLMTSSESENFLTHLENISNVLTDKKKSHILFYKNGINIERNNSFVFGELKKDGGFRAIIENYKIANFQDLKRKLFTIFFANLS